MSVSLPLIPAGRCALWSGILGLITLLSITPGISFTEDLGRHLLMGQTILHAGSVPKTNLLTYTAPDFPAIDHHWLSQVIFYLFHHIAGINGLILLKACLMTTALWLSLTAVPPRKAGWPFYLTGILCAVILGYRSHIRPELFTFLFIALYLRIFEKIRRGNTGIRFWILPAAWFWANTHLYFIFGIGMAGAFALEQWMQDRTARTFLKETAWFAAVAIASCLNPNGLKGFLYPFTVFSSFSVEILEIRSPLELWNLGVNPMLPALLMVSLAVVGAVAAPSIRYCKSGYRRASDEAGDARVRMADYLISIAALIASWWMARSVPLLALTAPSVISAWSNDLTRRDEVPGSRLTRPIRCFLMIMVISLNGLLLVSVLEGSYFRRFPAPNNPTPFGFDDDERFHRISRLTRDFDLTGPVFTDLSIGSLVEYQMYPERGYVDNRPEAFPEDFLQKEYRPALRLGPEFEKTIRSRRINTIIVTTAIGQAFIMNLISRPEWVLIHLDEFCAVFVRNMSKNQAIIDLMSYNESRLDSFELDIAQRLDRLPGIPFWKRQVETEIIALRLYALICIGELPRAWPHVWKLHELYPDYEAAYELIYACVPRERFSQVEPLFARRAKWPLSAKNVMDWGNYLIRQGKQENARLVFQRGRIFFPLDTGLKTAATGNAGRQSTGLRVERNLVQTNE